MLIDSCYLQSGQKAINFGQKQPPPQRKEKKKKTYNFFLMSQMKIDTELYAHIPKAIYFISDLV